MWFEYFVVDARQLTISLDRNLVLLESEGGLNKQSMYATPTTSISSPGEVRMRNGLQAKR